MWVCGSMIGVRSIIRSIVWDGLGALVNMGRFSGVDRPILGPGMPGVNARRAGPGSLLCETARLLL
jgi:hypothetical protein